MKKILINGCSFTAGDGLTWDKNYPDIEWDKYILKRKLHPVYSSRKVDEFYSEYKLKVRKLENIGGQLAKLLNIPVDDISIDGNSNDNISISTIGFFSGMSVEQKQEYHVCIGWTEPTRRLRWISRGRHFMNLHHSHSKDERFEYERPFIKECIINSEDCDHLLNFFNNVLLLETYLQHNKISYTFWKSLGWPYDMKYIQSAGSVDPALLKYKFFFHNELFDASKWVKFDDNPYPWLGTAWSTIIDDQELWLNNPVNLHPNLLAVEQFSERLSKLLVQ